VLDATLIAMALLVFIFATWQMWRIERDYRQLEDRRERDRQSFLRTIGGGPRAVTTRRKEEQKTTTRP
jgi:uncharacterized membrane protein YccC